MKSGPNCSLISPGKKRGCVRTHPLPHNSMTRNIWAKRQAICFSALPSTAACLAHLGSSYRGATSTLGTFPVFEVAQFNFLSQRWPRALRVLQNRCNSTPWDSPARNKVLLVFSAAQVPTITLVLGLDDKLQSLSTKRRAAHSPCYRRSRLTKRASFRWHLNLNPDELVPHLPTRSDSACA